MKRVFKKAVWISNAAGVEPRITDENLPIALKVSFDKNIEILDFCSEDGSFTGYVPAGYHPDTHRPSKSGYFLLEFGIRVRYHNYKNLKGRNPSGTIFQQVEFIIPKGIEVEFLFNEDDIGKAHYEMQLTLI